MSKNYVNIALFEFSIEHIRQHTEKLESKSMLIIVCDYMRYRLNTNYNMSSINWISLISIVVIRSGRVLLTLNCKLKKDPTLHNEHSLIIL